MTSQRDECKRSENAMHSWKIIINDFDYCLWQTLHLASRKASRETQRERERLMTNRNHKYDNNFKNIHKFLTELVCFDANLICFFFCSLENENIFFLLPLPHFLSASHTIYIDIKSFINIAVLLGIISAKRGRHMCAWNGRNRESDSSRFELWSATWVSSYIGAP